MAKSTEKTVNSLTETRGIAHVFAEIAGDFANLFGAYPIPGVTKVTKSKTERVKKLTIAKIIRDADDANAPDVMIIAAVRTAFPDSKWTDDTTAKRHLSWYRWKRGVKADSMRLGFMNLFAVEA